MAQAVLALLQEVHADGQTIVVVTHDPSIARAAWRLVRMQDGQIVDDGSSAELLGAEPSW
jgi:putative ABC transport system ATP-binding protein